VICSTWVYNKESACIFSLDDQLERLFCVVMQTGAWLVPGAGEGGRFPWNAGALQLSPVLPHRQAGPSRPCSSGRTKGTLKVVVVFGKFSFLLFLERWNSYNSNVLRDTMRFNQFNCNFFQECVPLLHSISFFAFEGTLSFKSKKLS